MCSWPHSEKVQVEKCKDYKLSRGSIQIPPVLDSNSESTLVNVEGTTNKKVSRPRSQHSEGIGAKKGGQIAKNKQPGSQHSEGIGSKTGGKIAESKQPGSQHSGEMGSKIVEKV